MMKRSRMESLKGFWHAAGVSHTVIAGDVRHVYDLRIGILTGDSTYTHTSICIERKGDT